MKLAFNWAMGFFLAMAAIRCIAAANDAAC